MTLTLGGEGDAPGINKVPVGRHQEGGTGKGFPEMTSERPI